MLSAASFTASTPLAPSDLHESYEMDARDAEMHPLSDAATCGNCGKPMPA